MLQRPFRSVVAFMLASAVAAPAVLMGQSGRVSGLVRDEDGKPIRGATVTAKNPDFGTATFTATTDNKGRFTIIGLRPGTWQFLAEAPGHMMEGGLLPVRSDGRLNPAMTFTLRMMVGTAGPLGSVSASDLQSALSRADGLFNERRWDDAIAAYRAVLSRAPALTVVNLQIGAAYRGKQDFDAAIAAYRELLEVDTNNRLARVGIALANLERGDTAAAEAALLPVSDDPVANRDVLFTLGEVKKAQGDAIAATEWYRRSVNLDPSWGKPRYRLAEAALGSGDTQTAARLFQEVIDVDPVSPESALAKERLETLNR